MNFIESYIRNANNTLARIKIYENILQNLKWVKNNFRRNRNIIKNLYISLLRY